MKTLRTVLLASCVLAATCAGCGRHLPQPGRTETSEFLTACEKGDLKEVQALLGEWSNPPLLNARDKRDWTPLHIVAFKGHTDAAAVLIAKGADVDAKDDQEYTALHLAVVGHSKGIVELLIEHGANVNARTRRGSTPLTLARLWQTWDVYGDERAIVSLLKNHGARY